MVNLWLAISLTTNMIKHCRLFAQSDGRWRWRFYRYVLGVLPWHEWVSPDHCGRVELEDGRDVMSMGNGNQGVHRRPWCPAKFGSHLIWCRVIVNLPREQDIKRQEYNRCKISKNIGVKYITCETVLVCVLKKNVSTFLFLNQSELLYQDHAMEKVWKWRCKATIKTGRVGLGMDWYITGVSSTWC